MSYTEVTRYLSSLTNKEYSTLAELKSAEKKFNAKMKKVNNTYQVNVDVNKFLTVQEIIDSLKKDMFGFCEHYGIQNPTVSISISNSSLICYEHRIKFNPTKNIEAFPNHIFSESLLNNIFRNYHITQKMTGNGGGWWKSYLTIDKSQYPYLVKAETALEKKIITTNRLNTLNKKFILIEANRINNDNPKFILQKAEADLLYNKLEQAKKVVESLEESYNIATRNLNSTEIEDKSEATTTVMDRHSKKFDAVDKWYNNVLENLKRESSEK